MSSNTEQQVLEAASPQEAMLALARGIDALLTSPPATGWGDIPWSPEVANSAAADEIERRVQVDVPRTEGASGEVVIPPPTSEKKELRRRFEQKALKLTEYLGTDEGTDWTEAYATGGPMWLYLGNRELVMSYPREVRMALVEDVEKDSPHDAHEMARDILKFPGETGPGGVAMRMAEGEIG